MAGFLQNTWYMAAWADELGENSIARTIVDIPLLLYRTAGGEPVALHDRCPHRFAPLSVGTRKGDTVQCRYHGLVFDSSGKCVENPLGGGTSAACKISAFPVVQQDRILWVWLGDAAKARRETIVRFPFLTDSNMRSVTGYTAIAAHYELLTDNLLDLTHVRFLHGALGGDTYRPTNSMEIDGESIVSHYFLKDVPNPTWPEIAWSSNGRNVDLWDDIRWTAPATLSLSSISTLAGRPRGEGFTAPSAHIIAPETEASSHYFWAVAVPKGSRCSEAEMSASAAQAFNSEDRPMIEAVQRSMRGADFWSLKPILLRTDAAVVRARQMLARMIAEEQAERNARAVPG